MMNTEIKIRKAIYQDAKLLSVLGWKTFNDTFAKDNKPSDMELYLAKTFTEAQLQKELTDKDSTFFLATSVDDVVGYAKVTTADKPGGLTAKNPIEIERLYSIKEFIGKGIGQLLMNTCIDHAKQNGHDVIWLGVWEHNARAIAFYEKFGFEKFSSRNFLLGADLQNDFLMAKNLANMAHAHHYTATTTWIGNNGSGTSDYKSYSRNHDISFEGKPALNCSSDPAFRGDKSRQNPEELLLASISGCHMLWYLHLCAVNKVVVVDYVDEAKGTMEENADGSGQFTEVILYPRVRVADASMIDKANALHHEANKMCFIARSLNFPVKHKPIATV